MTPQELAAFRELAGLNAPSTMEQNKAWADKQLVQKPPVGVGTPLNNLALKLQGIDQNGSKGKPPIDPDKNLDGLADRLNTLMRTPGTAKHIEPKKPEQPIEDVAGRLNSLMRQSATQQQRPAEQKQPDPNEGNVANRLNSLLGVGNFKIERLN